MARADAPFLITAPSGDRLPNRTASPPWRMSVACATESLFIPDGGIGYGFPRVLPDTVIRSILGEARRSRLHLGKDMQETPPARWTSSMCHFPPGLTLQRCGTRSEIRLYARQRGIRSRFVGNRKRVQHRVGGTAHRPRPGQKRHPGHRESQWSRGRMFLPISSKMSFAARPASCSRSGVRAKGRPVIGKRQTQSLHEAIHAVAVNMP